jgi:hypothetical protein
MKLYLNRADPNPLRSRATGSGAGPRIIEKEKNNNQTAACSLRSKDAGCAGARTTENGVLLPHNLCEAEPRGLGLAPEKDLPEERVVGILAN